MVANNNHYSLNMCVNNSLTHMKLLINIIGKIIPSLVPIILQSSDDGELNATHHFQTTPQVATGDCCSSTTSTHHMHRYHGKPDNRLPVRPVLNAFQLPRPLLRKHITRFTERPTNHRLNPRLSSHVSSIRRQEKYDDSYHTLLGA